jgi:hypothetical protein
MLANGMPIMTRLGMLLDVRLLSRIQVMPQASLTLNYCAVKVHSLDRQVMHV